MYKLGRAAGMLTCVCNCETVQRRKRTQRLAFIYGFN